MATFESPLSVGDIVFIDGDESGKATVTALLFKPHLSDVEVSYVFNGDPKQFWCAPWRLTLAKTESEVNYPRLPTCK